MRKQSPVSVFRYYRILGIALAILITVEVALVFCVPAYNTALARTVWKTTGNAPFTLLLDRSDPWLAIEIGNHYFNGGAYQPDTALDAYVSAVRIDTSIPIAHYQISRLLFIRSDFTNARLHLLEALSLNPENQRVYYMLGLVDAYRGYYADAEKEFGIFIASAPTEWAGYNDLALVLSLQDKYVETEKLMYQALTTVPDAASNAWLWNSLSVAELNQGKYKKALASCERAGVLLSTLTPDDYRRAYPGNDPLNATQGLQAFKDAVATNRRTIESYLSAPRAVDKPTQGKNAGI